MRNFLSLNDLEKHEINSLVEQSLAFKNKEVALPNLSNVTIANLFFEASTRTNASFYQAQLKTNMNILNIDMSNLSTQKGETLIDTVEVFKAIEVDGLVIRHNKEFYYEDLVNHFFMGFINAGDGKNEHPSQALLDLVTIKENFDNLEGLKVMIVGDLKHSRVARSNVELLKRFGMEVYLASPSSYKDDSFEDGMYVNIDDMIDKVDVLMLLRVQNERHENLNKEENYLEKFGLTKKRYDLLKDNAIVMHPGPYNRNVEIDESVIHLDKSKIWEQVTNGLYARIAILNYVFNKED